MITQLFADSGFGKEQIPTFSLILHEEKYQQVEGKAAFNSMLVMQSAVREQSNSVPAQPSWLYKLNLTLATYDLPTTQTTTVHSTTTTTTTVHPINLSLVNIMGQVVPCSLLKVETSVRFSAVLKEAFFSFLFFLNVLLTRHVLTKCLRRHGSTSHLTPFANAGYKNPAYTGCPLNNLKSHLRAATCKPSTAHSSSHLNWTEWLQHRLTSLFVRSGRAEERH